MTNPTTGTVCNLYRLPLIPEIAHDGHGEVRAKRIATDVDIDGACNFMDYVEIPPGVTIGDHRHGEGEEEFYLFLAGNGQMRVDDEVFNVTAGDLVRNRPGGIHGLINTGIDVIRLFVFELAVAGRD